MRLTLAASIFALAVLAAACGGGGKSGMLPSSPGQPSGPSAPAGALSHLAVTLKIPPATHQSNARKPFLLSPSTQSIVFAVVNEGQTPTPAEAQLFPIATPSPCSIATSGDESCTFNVQAPFGTDIFYIATFGVTTPTLSSVPLASFTSSPIVVASPGVGTTPVSLTFVVNGVVAMVKLVVASPDPATSNNQIFTAGTSTTPQPLTIMPEDANGNPILAQTFSAPITINVSPAPAGVGLVFSPTCSTSTTSGRRATKRRDFPVSYATITIGCPADLANVSYVYDGTVGFDSSQHIADNFTISATQLISPAPSPATISLASSVSTTQVTSGAFPGYSYSPTSMQTLADGTFLFAYEYNSQPWIGTFNPATQTVTAPVALSGGPTALLDPSEVAVANGALWIGDGSNGLFCYASVADAMSGQPPVLSGVFPVVPADGSHLWIHGLATDSAGNLWFAGEDSGSGGPPPAYVGYIPAPSGCAASGLTAPFELGGSFDDATLNVVALPSPALGIVVQNSNNIGNGPDDVYVITTNSLSPVPAVAPVLSSGSGAGLATDGVGNIYVAYTNGNGNADIETMAQAASALNILTPLPPYAPNPGMPAIPLAAFGANGGAADRLAYADSNYGGLGLIENVPASPMPVLVNLPHQDTSVATTYATDGTEYTLYADSSSNLYLAHTLVTRTWSVPSVQVTNYCNSAFYPVFVGILERNNSGPFTFTSTGSVVATAIAGLDHDYALSSLPAGTTGTFNVTVSDSHGRTETVPITSNYSTAICGLAHRHAAPPH